MFQTTTDIYVQSETASVSCIPPAPSEVTLKSSNHIESLCPDIKRGALTNDVWEQPGVAQQYQHFARADWYAEANRYLLKVANIDQRFLDGASILDLGSGTGCGSRLLASNFPRQQIIAFDRSRAMLEFAKDISISTGCSNINYRCGDVTELNTLVPEPISAVFAFNAMHLFSNLSDVLIQLGNRLPSEACLAFNTAFARDAIARQDLPATLGLTKEIRRLISQSFPETAQSPMPTPCSRGMTRQDYIELLQRTGYKVLVSDFRRVEMSAESLADFLCMPGFAADIIPANLPESERKSIFSQAIENMRNKNCSIYPRNWLSIVALKI